MKKALLIIVVFLLFGGAAFAEGDGLKVYIGPKIGYQTSQLSYDKDDIKNSFIDNFTLGAFGRFDFGNLYVQPEVLWFRTSNLFDLSISREKAAALGYNFPNGLQFTMERNAMNIQVPVLVGYEVDLRVLTLRTQVGPTANFVIPGKTLIEKTLIINGQPPLPEPLKDAEFDTKTISWGIQFGVGVDVFRFTLDVNYNLGITKVFGSDIVTGLHPEWVKAIDFSNIDLSKQHTFMVTLGYRFL